MNGRQLTGEDREALASSYRAVLDLASESGLVKSVALCGISTGVFGFPQEDAARIAIGTVSDWLGQNPGRLDHVVFNTYGEEATAIYQSTIEQQNWK